MYAVVISIGRGREEHGRAETRIHAQRGAGGGGGQREMRVSFDWSIERRHVQGNPAAGGPRERARSSRPLAVHLVKYLFRNIVVVVVVVDYALPRTEDDPPGLARETRINWDC